MKTDTEWEARARELLSRDFDWCPPKNVHGDIVKAALKLGREMQADVLEHARDVLMPAAASHAADARAEEIARRLDEEAWTEAVQIARSTITKPKTREQVLEEALREMPCSCVACGREARFHEAGCAFAAARRALEWKP